ncbi:formyltetrahydrofolate deformylase [Helicobacter muridarum]|uniref:Formyltetrahydrofolate deformylase n=1 Tax=Helicobacter muridarum TaxID=216 RepID=A0A377PU91_9HELI|nr:formyltetrahydrofolate deformylase [Helicobacter muridarum]TLE01107.1 formyltetrahydrofolate deformylase [Helicobacter muridarum]STQ85972.1 formyltetrahydrofolate deformylase [Helicobacter muridarum]
MELVILISATDRKGLIYNISSVLYELGLNIERNDEYVDRENLRFFMRTHACGEVDNNVLYKRLIDILPTDSMLKIQPLSKKNIIILCTKENHCIGDLLLRHDSGELNANIKAIISNHNILSPLADKFGIPFFHIPSNNLSRESHEAKILEVIKFNIDYLVLAKYMRILTSNFTNHFYNKIINIHHSFLPAFIGANPYKQAYERGVKIIGATAHFVNENLDEGPIITQDIIHINHSYSWRDMQRAGRDIEKVVLSRALNFALEDRIFVYKNKTIVF